MPLNEKGRQSSYLLDWRPCLSELPIVYTFSVQIATKNEKYFIAKT